MAAETIRLEGQKELANRLRALGGSRLRRAAIAAVQQGMKPLLQSAKRLVPVSSGRLRASLGAGVQVRRRKDGAIGRVGPRRDFRFTGKGRLKGQKLVSGSGKQRDKALAKGYAQDRTNPSMYARGIELGVDKSGRVRRKAGPARFMIRALESQKQAAIDAVAAELRSRVAP
ncbi:hypothetical protein LBMAG53_39480 [Planctomycetota bacterium]|nr:hypothetical protein LBMAG53_39480 [Planctomycetota bacterium]